MATVYRPASKKPPSNSGCSSTAHVQLLRVSEWQQLAAAVTAGSRPGSRAVASLQSPPTWQPPASRLCCRCQKVTEVGHRPTRVSPSSDSLSWGNAWCDSDHQPLPAETLMEFCGRGNGLKMKFHEATWAHGWKRSILSRRKWHLCFSSMYIVFLCCFWLAFWPPSEMGYILWKWLDQVGQNHFLLLSENCFPNILFKVKFNKGSKNLLAENFYLKDTIETSIILVPKEINRNWLNRLDSFLVHLLAILGKWIKQDGKAQGIRMQELKLCHGISVLTRLLTTLDDIYNNMYSCSIATNLSTIAWVLSTLQRDPLNAIAQPQPQPPTPTPNPCSPHPPTTSSSLCKHKTQNKQTALNL